MRRKRKSLTPDTPLAPVPSEILDQFVRQGPISHEELEAAVSAPLNIDMVGPNNCDEASEANTVYVVGADRISTELHNVNEDANAALLSPLTLNYDLNDPSDLESSADGSTTRVLKVKDSKGKDQRRDRRDGRAVTRGSAGHAWLPPACLCASAISAFRIPL